MKDLDHLCVHGREIACPECVDDARAERLEREAQREVAAEMLTEEQQRHAETQRALIIANTTQANLHAVIAAKNYAIVELERDYARVLAEAQRWQTWHDEKSEQCRQFARQLLDAERARDEARAEVTFKDKVIWAARADVNESVALLKECRPWVARGLDDHPAPTDDDRSVLARLDAFLAKVGKGER